MERDGLVVTERFGERLIDLIELKPILWNDLQDCQVPQREVICFKSKTYASETNTSPVAPPTPPSCAIGFSVPHGAKRVRSHGTH